MEVELLQLPKKCPIVGPAVFLSAGRHISEYWVQISDGHRVMLAHLNGAEWREWLAEIGRVQQGQRAAVLPGVVREEE